MCLRVVASNADISYRFLRLMLLLNGKDLSFNEWGMVISEGWGEGRAANINCCAESTRVGHGTPRHGPCYTANGRVHG